MKKLLFLLLLTATTQFVSAQLTNPGRDDGPRGVIPQQAKPQIKTPKVVLGTTKCSCGNPTNGGGWDGIGFIVGETPLAKYSCGYQFNSKTSEKITFVSGGYNCAGRDTDIKCVGIVSGTLFKDDVLVRNISVFNFSTEVIEFQTSGNYRLVLTARCKTAKCGSCVYYFTIR